MVPRYTLGAWYTDLNYEYQPGTEVVDRYRYSDRDIRETVDRFRSEHIPLDVLVLDFAWHTFGWEGGYDWSPIFPDPAGFLAWAHRSGLHVTLNDHPGYGAEGVLSSRDSHAGEIIRRLNIKPPPRPAIEIDLAREWRFKTDPRNWGMREQWFAPGYSDSAWNTINAGALWEGQGYTDYDGVGWYRKWVSVPAGPKVDSLFLVFGGVDDEFDLFVNGNRVGHLGAYPDNSMYGTQTETEVSHFIRPGEQNLVVLRVNDWGGGGGITKAPVVLSDVIPQGGIRFNLADKPQAQAFMEVLHNPLIDQGVDFWWIDGGSGSCAMPGLDSQMWTNRVFYDFTADHTKKRTFIFSRYGGPGSHRYPGNFTGDTYSQWEVLAYEVPFTARGGNVLMPFITHDIGGFQGDTISFDLYARWLQFGAFSPVLRLHCAYENPRYGNLRLPWLYGRRGTDLARSFFQLRYRLLPYIYTYCRIAHDEALPLVRPLYLEYPALGEAYAHPDEYLFGREFLVAPIVDSTGERDVYLPPGTWFDYFSGKTLPGGQTIHVRHPLETMPLFVRGGSVIPLQADMASAGARPLDTLIVEVFPGPSGRFRLYEDDGLSLDFGSGRYAWTRLASTEGPGTVRIDIDPVRGSYAGQVQRRACELRVHRSAGPHAVAVNGQPLPVRDWTWDGARSLLVIRTGVRDIRTRVSVTVR
jgi:alpha-glucosidase (family GH31 glycosyl hydrolase)